LEAGGSCPGKISSDPSGEEPGRPSFRKIPADRFAIWKMHDQFDVPISRDRLRHQFGCFYGGVVAELVSSLGADDPVVETVVRNNMNGAAASL
jgi:hypothetical protein